MNEMITPIHHKIYTLFPEDFMFQLTQEEYDSLRSQFVTLETGRGKHERTS